MIDLADFYLTFKSFFEICYNVLTFERIVKMYKYCNKILKHTFANCRARTYQHVITKHVPQTTQPLSPSYHMKGKTKFAYIFPVCVCTRSDNYNLPSDEIFAFRNAIVFWSDVVCCAISLTRMCFSSCKRILRIDATKTACLSSSLTEIHRFRLRV